MTGRLIAIEGLDQSGKETQGRLLRDALRARGLKAEYVTFPDYSTPIGQQIQMGLHGDRAFNPAVMQLLFVANRFERKEHISSLLRAGTHVISDRYLASSVAYGEAQGLDPAWLAEMQKYLPQPARTLLLDIDPATAAKRKAVGRDRFESDLLMLQRVRESYLIQSRQPGWCRIDAARDKDAVAQDVLAAVGELFAE